MIQYLQCQRFTEASCAADAGGHLGRSHKGPVDKADQRDFVNILKISGLSKIRIPVICELPH